MITQNISVLRVCSVLRGVEKYVSLEEEGWKSRYACVCSSSLCNYVRMLSWLWRYYRLDVRAEECVEVYECKYAPLLREVSVLDVESAMALSVALSSELMCKLDAYTQLAYVLPRSSQNLMPKKLMEEILSDESSCDLYPSTYSFDWAFCTYFWECHPNLPKIPLETLEKWNKKSILYRESLKSQD
jgi:5'-3' exonuclease